MGWRPVGGEGKAVKPLIKRLARREVSNSFVCEAGLRHDLDDLEGRPAHIVAHHLQVSQLADLMAQRRTAESFRRMFFMRAKSKMLEGGLRHWWGCMGRKQGGSRHRESLDERVRIFQLIFALGDDLRGRAAGR